MLSTVEIIDTVAELRGDAPIITGPGTVTALTLLHHGAHALLPNMELGYATAVAHGLAETGLDRVLALEGDGSILSELTALVDVGVDQPDNLIVIVVDDQRYSAFGDDPVQPTATAVGVDLVGIARSCGIEHTVAIDDVATLRATLGRAMREPGPWVLVCRVPAQGLTRIRPMSLDPDIIDGATLFRRELAARRATAASTTDASTTAASTTAAAPTTAAPTTAAGPADPA